MLLTFKPTSNDTRVSEFAKYTVITKNSEVLVICLKLNEEQLNEIKNSTSIQIDSEYLITKSVEVFQEEFLKKGCYTVVFNF